MNTDWLYDNIIIFKVIACFVMLIRFTLFRNDEFAFAARISRNIIIVMCLLISAIYMKHFQYNYSICWAAFSLCWLFIINDKN